MANVVHGVTLAGVANPVSLFSTVPVTPAAGDLLYVMVTAKTTVAAGRLVDTQGLGFTKVTSAVFNSGADTHYAFIANALAAQKSMTITFDCDKDPASTGAVIYVARISGMSRAGLSAIRQFAKIENQTASPISSPVFSRICLTENPTIESMGSGESGMVAPTGWTELADGQDSEYHARDSGFAGNNINWVDTVTTGYANIAVEFDTSPTTLTYKGPCMIDAGLGALNSSQSSSQLVRTSTGNLYAAIVTSGDVRVYKSTNNGVSWAQQDYRNVPPTSGTIISAAIDSSDIIHIVYLSRASVGNHSYVQFSTTTDTFGSVESPASTALSQNSVAIAIDSNNVPHVAMLNSNGVTPELRYVNRVGGSWRPTVQVSASRGNGVDIQIDRNNVPIISFIGTTVAGINVALGNKNAATSFSVTTLLSTVASSGSSLAIDSSNNVWVAYAGVTGRLTLQNHISTDAWATWQTAIDNRADGLNPSLAGDPSNIYLFYERNLGGIAYDRYDTANAKWLGETILQTATPAFRPHDPFVKWSQYFNNGDTAANNANQQTIEYLFDDGTTVYYDRLVTAQISTGLAEIKFTPNAAATTTSTSSTSSSTSTSISTSSTSSSISTSSTSSSTSISTSSTSSSLSTSSTSSSISTSSTSTSTSTSQSTSTSSTSTSTSKSTSTSSTSSSISTSSTSSSISTSSTSSSISTSSTSSSTSQSSSTSSTSSSTSTSISTSSTSSSTSLSTSSTSSSVSTSTSVSTSSTSSSTSLSTSSTSSSTSISTSSTSQSTSTSVSTSSTSSSTSISTSSTSSSISTSSTSTSISTSSTSSSTSTSKSTSTSSTSQSTSTSISTSSTSSSVSTSSTSTSISTSSTSSSISTSSTSSSTSRSTSTSSTSQSTSTSLSTSTSSTSSSISTSSTSSSTSLSTSTSSTSSSTSISSTSTSTTVSLTTSTSSTSSSTSTTQSTSTSSTSQSTSTSSSTSSTSGSTSQSTSTSSTSTSLSTSTSSTSQSTSSSTSISSTSSSTSTTVSYTTSTSSTSTSFSSTSISSSTSTTLPPDSNFHPRSSIAADTWWSKILPDEVKTKIKTRTR